MEEVNCKEKYCNVAGSLSKLTCLPTYHCKGNGIVTCLLFDSLATVCGRVAIPKPSVPTPPNRPDSEVLSTKQIGKLDTFCI